MITSTIIAILVITIISGVLYRTPRGGGLGEGKSFEGSYIWAATSSILWALFYSSWIPLLMIPIMMLGEAPAWSQYWPNRPDGGDKNKLNLRGALLLNPFMGEITFKMYDLEQKNKLPKLKRWLTGWTEWSELICGHVTGLAYSIIIVLTMMIV